MQAARRPQTSADPSAMLSPLMHTPLQTAPSSSTNRTPAIDTAARADATQALLVGGGDDAVKQTDLTIAEQGCRPLTVPPEDVCWYVRVTIHLQGAPPSQAVCFGGPVERVARTGALNGCFCPYSSEGTESRSVLETLEPHDERLPDCGHATAKRSVPAKQRRRRRASLASLDIQRPRRTKCVRSSDQTRNLGT